MLTCTSPSSAAISTADLKIHMRVESTDTSQDDAIDGFGLAAQRYVEDRCRMTLGISTWTVRTDQYIIPLEMGVFFAVSTVQTISDTSTTEDVTDYRVNKTPSQAVVVIDGTVSLEDGDGDPLDFYVAYTAKAPSVAEDQMTQATAMLAAHFYAHRESVIKGTIAAPTPMGVDMLCDSISLARM